MIWFAGLSPDGRQPVPRALRIHVIGTDGCVPQCDHLAPFGGRILQAALSIEGNGNLVPGVDGVSVIAAKYPALRLGQCPPFSLALNPAIKIVQVVGSRAAEHQGAGAIGPIGCGQLLDHSRHLGLGLRDPTQVGQRLGVLQ
ncbi:MAG TPA: hypothetical protein VHZ33_06385 [Trebonia sp.]|nr:hypothetical protein [Trebonia sp.]